MWLYGYGWPRDKGGLLYYGDQIGSKKILQFMERLSRDDNNIKISNLLYECSQGKISFLDIDTGGLIAK